jgi:hypothetical protein
MACDLRVVSRASSLGIGDVGLGYAESADRRNVAGNCYSSPVDRADILGFNELGGLLHFAGSC